MSYKYDSMLVLANKYGLASNDAKAEMFETYDRIRDLTVSGPNINGAGGYGTAGTFLMNLSRLIAPSSFMSTLGSSAINIPGTSYNSPISGGVAVSGAQSAFGMKSMTNYPGFPGGAAALDTLSDIGNSFSNYYDDGSPTGGAASTVAGNSYVPAVGALTGVSAASGNFSDAVLPIAGVIGGIGGLVGSLSPYFGPMGLVAGTAGNIASGYAGAVLGAYQSTAARVLNNADSILSMKVKNLETVVKELDTQGDIVRKMLKTGIEGDSKAIQEM